MSITSKKGGVILEVVRVRSELPEKGALFWKLKGLVSESFTGGWKGISKLLSVFTAAFAVLLQLRFGKNRFEPGMHSDRVK